VLRREQSGEHAFPVRAVDERLGAVHLQKNVFAIDAKEGVAPSLVVEGVRLLLRSAMAEHHHAAIGALAGSLERILVLRQKCVH
jgi:hypothetical protein